MNTLFIYQGESPINSLLRKDNMKLLQLPSTTHNSTNYQHANLVLKPLYSNLPFQRTPLTSLHNASRICGSVIHSILKAHTSTPFSCKHFTYSYAYVNSRVCYVYVRFLCELFSPVQKWKSLCKSNELFIGL